MRKKESRISLLYVKKRTIRKSIRVGKNKKRIKVKRTRNDIATN